MRFLKHVSFSLLILFLVSCNNTPTTSSSDSTDEVFHTVQFDSKGGSAVESQRIKHGEKAIKPNDPTKEGYSFDCWTYNNEAWSFVGYVVTEDMTLVANWNANVYTLELTNTDSTQGSIRGGGQYEFGSTVTVSATAYTGYSFSGWYTPSGDLVSTEATYSFAMGFDSYLYAHWNGGNFYTVRLNPTIGTVPVTTIQVQYGKQYSIPDASKLGYQFTGWYDGSWKVNSNGIWNYAYDKTLSANWSIITYSITYELNGGTNYPSNPSSYTVESIFTFGNPERKGYEFLGWYLGDSPITGIAKGTTGSLTIEARWNANQNTLNVASEDEAKGTVSIVSGTGYTDESITVQATPNAGCIFDGWYHNNSKVSTDLTYSFVMPTEDYSLVAHFFTNEEKQNIDLGIKPYFDFNNMTVTYGLYPQKNINDETLVSALEEIETPGYYDWYLYNGEYYAKFKTFTNLDFEYHFDNGTLIEPNTTYWFKCEPILWDILSTDNGYLLLSHYLLDYRQFHSTSSRWSPGGGDDNTYSANNYEMCDLRKWLNGGFYNLAFGFNSSIIQTANLGPSIYENHDDVKDKVFLLSYDDYTSQAYGLNVYTKRQCKTTDWVRSTCSYFISRETDYLNNAPYWTRTSSSQSPNWHYVCAVYPDGNIYNKTEFVTNTSCVRPSLTIQID